MDLERATPIGSSLLHLLGETESSDVSPPAQSLASGIDSTVRSVPCMLLPRKSNRSNRMLLHGPRKSGRSSLAMNLAYSCASTMACDCLDSCQCVAVTMYRKSSLEDPDFPLFCNPITPDGEQTKDFSSRYQQLNQPKTKEDWDTRILKRIQIKNVSSVREVLMDLLSILGKSLSQQPCRAIILDDIDALVSNEPNSTLSIMQILAIATDTTYALQRLHGTLPMLLATAESNIVAPWMETVVSLHQSSSQQSRQSKGTKGSIQINSFQAEVKDEETGSLIVEYSLVKTHEGGVRIHWFVPSSQSNPIVNHKH